MSQEPEVATAETVTRSAHRAEKRRLNAEARRERRDLRRKSKARAEVRAKEIDHGLVFDEIRPDMHIAKDPLGYEETQRFRQDIADCFSAEINLMPELYGELFPRLFDTVYRNELGDSFPADTPARDLSGRLRQVLVNNIKWLAILKVVFYALSSVLMYILLVIPLGHIRIMLKDAGIQINDTYLNLSVCVASLSISAFTFWFSHYIVYHKFDDRSTRSCLKAAGDLQSVFNGIESAYRDALQNIQTDGNWGEAMANQWPERAAWWAKLILWYPKRVEHLERAFQIEMWRIRLRLAIYRVASWVATVSASLLLLGAAFWFGPALGLPATIVFIAFVVATGFLSAWLWAPALDYVRDNEKLRTEHWNRFKTFRSDEQIGKMMQQNMNQIIREQRHP